MHVNTDVNMDPNMGSNMYSIMDLDMDSDMEVNIGSDTDSIVDSDMDVEVASFMDDDMDDGSDLDLNVDLSRSSKDKDPDIRDPNIADANDIGPVIVPRRKLARWRTTDLELLSMQSGQNGFTYPIIQEMLHRRFWISDVVHDHVLERQLKYYPWPKALLKGVRDFDQYEGGIVGCPDSKTLVFMNIPYDFDDKVILYFFDIFLGVNRRDLLSYRFRRIQFHDQSMYTPCLSQAKLSMNS